MLYSVKHTTVYTYTDLVPFCHNLAILSPRNTPSQECREFQLDITPVPEVVEMYDDFFGNKVYYFVVEQEHKELTVTARSVIESKTPAWKQSGLSQQSWELVKNSLDTSLINGEIKQYTFPTGITEATPSIKSYAQRSFMPGRPLYDATLELTGRIYEDFKYTAGFTTVTTPLSVVMREKKGVCQDFAHFAIACLQSMGLTARYVSGYLETLPPPGEPKLVGSDASHAWISVYIPGMDWVDFDPTNNKHPDEQYITIGWGRNYFDVIPLRGVIQSSHKHELEVAVDVIRLSG